MRSIARAVVMVMLIVVAPALFARSAHAVTLNGGPSCYASGNGVAGSSAYAYTDARPTCTSGSVYLATTFYTSPSTPVGACSGKWTTGNGYCFAPTGYGWMGHISTHNLCYSWCNGYVVTCTYGICI